MTDQKMDNLLNLALDAAPGEREKSRNLNVGYNQALRRWDVIVKYSGPPEGLMGEELQVVPLLGGYAVVTLPEAALAEFTQRPQVEFVEMPKRLYFEVFQGKEASCIPSLQTGREGLTGRGVLMGIVDSGIDYRHPAFRNADGSTRLLRLWDQSIPGNPPDGYVLGTEYTKEEINEALALSEMEGRRLVPSVDVSGHGTAVAGVAAGNGRVRSGQPGEAPLPRDSSVLYQGVAYESDLIVVKMGTPGEGSFPRTTELMQGIDYLVRQAQALGRPMAVNLSFGNNYGSHRGDSLLETYIDNVSNIGRICLCTGTGNNGNDALHTGGRLTRGETQEIELGVSAYEPTLNVQLWKSYEDELEIYLESPAGTRIGPLYESLGPQRHFAGNTELLIYYGKPAPYHVTQEIYIDFLPSGTRTYVDSGIWKIILRGQNVREGEYFLWLPGGNVLNRNTAFFLPRAQGTLTIPSTARKIITAGAYDSRQNVFAGFSGRGSRLLPYQKPDLAAPGVNITAPRPGGSYASFTGTSFAAPFVSGACALLMERGIVRGNDPFLYGEKVKAYLRRGARPLAGYEVYPNEEVGWGTLCLKDSLPD